jgi:hypothetical protein
MNSSYCRIGVRNNRINALRPSINYLEHALYSLRSKVYSTYYYRSKREDTELNSAKPIEMRRYRYYSIPRDVLALVYREVNIIVTLNLTLYLLLLLLK